MSESRRSYTTVPTALGNARDGVIAIPTTAKASPSAITRRSDRIGQDELELAVATGAAAEPSAAGPETMISGDGAAVVVVATATAAFFLGSA
jgi:hypothetical protein